MDVGANKYIQLFVDEWKAFGMLDRLKPQVYIQIRPIKMTWRWLFYVQDLADGCILEPRKLLVGKESLVLSHEKPETMLGDVSDFDL
jgi:hypothetical protein